MTTDFIEVSEAGIGDKFMLRASRIERISFRGRTTYINVMGRKNPYVVGETMAEVLQRIEYAEATS